MSKLPTLSGEQLVNLLVKLGFQKIRQKGSHVTLAKSVPEKKLQTVVPLHDELAKGTLLAILRQCEVTKEELYQLLH